MKNIKTSAFLFVLGMSLILCQSSFAQQDAVQQKVLKNQDVIAKSFIGENNEVLTNGNERFIISVGGPTIGIMKGSSETQGSYWYVSVSGFNKGPGNEAVLKKSSGDLESDVESEVSLPTEFGISQNYPNPFNPTTTINFQIPEKVGSEISTSLKIYDINGRLVRTLVNEELPPGYYSEYWNGLNDNGVKVSSGIYFYGLRAGNYTSTQKMVMIK